MPAIYSSLASAACWIDQVIFIIIIVIIIINTMMMMLMMMINASGDVLLHGELRGGEHCTVGQLENTGSLKIIKIIIITIIIIILMPITIILMILIIILVITMIRRESQQA